MDEDGVSEQAYSKRVAAQVYSQDDVSKQAYISRKRDNASMN